MGDCQKFIGCLADDSNISFDGAPEHKITLVFVEALRNLIKERIDFVNGYFDVE